ncbi:MAG: ABC transporter ATP-binding protein [Rhodocyclaceae bacterium]|jgi:putative ABC transport system ATP-binding protein|nr:ABC transporter ATP-binding protein [Rhodocyclaceae bacterium]
MRAAPACISAQSLRYRWPGQAADCLNCVQMEIRAGERVFLHGASGAGKSTLLGLVAGVLVPSAGELLVMGQSLAALSGPQRDVFRADHMGILFQQFNLIPYLPVLDNVLLPCRFSRRRLSRCTPPADPVQDARRLLDHLEIGVELHGRAASQLSVGQQQRVAAARALIGRPELVIADEPTSALDAARQSAFLDLLARECGESGATLLFVSHDLRLQAHFDRVVSL